MKTKSRVNLASFCLGSIALLNSCTIPAHIPYSSQEKKWLAHAIAGQSLDLITTRIALNNGFEEANPLFDDENFGRIILAKSALLGITYLAGEIYPEGRETFYKIDAFLGYGAAAFNTMQIAREERLED